MFPVLSKIRLAEGIYKIVVRAPRIAVARRTGQFVIVRPSEEGERIPLTIARANPQQKSITLVFQVVGGSTRQLASLEVGDELMDLVGPLGQPTEIGEFDHAVCMGGGVGIALIWPIAEALQKKCSRVTGIISARTADLLILEDVLSNVCDELKVATDDGSRGHHGFPTDLLEDMLGAEASPEAVYAVGPVPMMSAVSDTSRPYGVKTIVSLNPIMVDGTGMCGGCRVTVGGETKFACVDGPEFDGHEVDFKELMRRLQRYQDAPKARQLPEYRSAGTCSARHTQLQEAAIEAGRSAEHPTDIPRQVMPEQDPEDRVRNFEEVPFGLEEEQAVLEAQRCLQCKNPSCVDGCPVGIDIPGFIKLIAERKFAESAYLLKEDNTLPAVCGRVCPQEEQCEEACVLDRKGDPIAIGNLERFAADYERDNDLVRVPDLPPRKESHVAVVGSGPAGLTAAGELARRGYPVKVLEALHSPGGVLAYGIPEFRLPKEIVGQEIDYLKSLGVEVETNFVVGKTAGIQDLFDEGYRAIFIGTGAGLPIFPHIEGENFNGVLSANEYLTRVNLMKAYRSDYETPVTIRRQVAVLGGGNVAMDAARTARRLGAEEVTIVYRRSVDEAPARNAELKHAEEEGINFKWLNNAVAILGNDEGWVNGLRCVEMELGERGEDGRRRPHPIEGSEFEFPVEMVIVGYGNRPHPLLPKHTEGLNVTDRGTIEVEENTGATSLEGVYAGGDIVTGAATVIQAMGAGKRSAAAIDEYISSKYDE